MALMTVSLNNAPLTVGGQKGHPLCKEKSEGSGGRRAVVPLLFLLLLHPPWAQIHRCPIHWTVRLLLQLMPIQAQCDVFLRTFFSGTGSLSRLCFNGVAKTTRALDTKGYTPDNIAWQFESFLEKGAVLRRESERGGGATFKHSA